MLTPTASSSPVLFVPGNGRRGFSSWEREYGLSRPDWLFLDPADCGDPFVSVPRLDSLLAVRRHALVAASYGALAAMLAVAARPEQTAGLVLFEPACFAVAAADDAVQQYVAPLRELFASAHSRGVSDREFSERFARLTGSTLPDNLDPVAVSQACRSLRESVPPWDVTVSVSVAGFVPTVVVTSGEDTVYERVAAALGAAGAARVHLRGFGHRVWSHPAATQLVDAFVSLCETTTVPRRDQAATDFVSGVAALVSRLPGVFMVAG